MAELTPHQALQQLNTQALRLKDLILEYGKLTGMAETDREAYLIYLTRMFRIHQRTATQQLSEMVPAALQAYREK